MGSCLHTWPHACVLSQHTRTHAHVRAHTHTESQCFTVPAGLVARSGLVLKQSEPTGRVPLRRGSSSRRILMSADKKGEGEGEGGKFEKLEARLEALKKDAQGYKGSEVEDLADGLVDDVTGLQKRLDETKKQTNKKKTGVCVCVCLCACVCIQMYICIYVCMYI